jgi:prepilin-type N-terminal cleavage/methylation domain-containing protein
MSRSVKNTSGFSMLELIIVIVIIGILSALGWPSMNEVIQTNRAKEASRALTAFAERAVAESKMRKEPVEIRLNDNVLEAYLVSADELLLFNQSLDNGFSANNEGSTPPNYSKFANNSVTSKFQIGLSGISGEGCFVVCNSSGSYCGSAVKAANKNTFTAYIKRKNSGWEVL